ncbi:MAG: hypothetical protein EOO19_02755 [Chryseobacterium sp.]|nr:MAG: hypothetical protein EOO19_02755 [Chryseobacterium sp.]
MIPQAAWHALGFSVRMTVAQARERASQINAQNTLEANRIKNAAARVFRFELVESAFLPESVVAEFERQIVGESLCSETHKRKMMSHWKRLRDLILELQLPVEEYVENKNRIYAWFVREDISLEYASKLIGLLNRWCKLNCKREGKFYDPVPAPKGHSRQKIADNYFAAETYRGESNPLTPALLDQTRSSLTEEQYNWLYISIWFGLRPQEINSLRVKNTRNWKIEYDRRLAVRVLSVDQPKLTSIEMKKRMKQIPCWTEEQIQALKMIESGKFKAPSYKQMRKLFENRITLYGGRKNFVSLMLDRDQGIEDISAWLGHQSIEMTWSKYRDKMRVSYKKKSA